MPCASAERVTRPWADCNPIGSWMSNAKCGEAVRVVRMDARRTQTTSEGFLLLNSDGHVVVVGEMHCRRPVVLWSARPQR